MDGAYVRDILAPSLKLGDVIVLDNLPSHKVARVQEAIAAWQAQVFYLPPYSPDLNPIEMALSSRLCCGKSRPEASTRLSPASVACRSAFGLESAPTSSTLQDINAQSENALVYAGSALDSNRCAQMPSLLGIHEAKSYHVKAATEERKSLDVPVKMPDGYGFAQFIGR